MSFWNVQECISLKLSAENQGNPDIKTVYVYV